MEKRFELPKKEKTIENESLKAIRLEGEILELLESGRIPKTEKTQKIEQDIEDGVLDNNQMEQIVMELKKIEEISKTNNISYKEERYFDRFGEMRFFRPEIERIKNEIADSAKNLENFLGKGYVAEVYKDERVPEICFKIVKDFNEYSLGNNVQQEADFLDELVDLNIDGARACKPYYYLMERGLHVIAMETLDAVSIDDVKNGKAKIPSKFILGIFMQKLKKFMAEMHELKIHHWDLHEGNVMIDNTTGDPRVIDFGLARKHFLKDENPSASFIVGKTRKRGIKDEDGIQNIEKELKKLMNEKKKG